MSLSFSGGGLVSSPAAALYDQLSAYTLCGWINVVDFASGNGQSVVLAKDPINSDAPFLAADNVNVAFGVTSWTYDDGFGLFIQSTSVANVLVAGQWAHVAATFSYVTGGSIKLYINGVEPSYHMQDSMPAGQTPLATPGGGWFMGSDTSGTNLDGQLSDVRIYNTVLTQPQIASIVAGGSPSPANLVSWWKMCDASPLSDSSGNGKNLTNSGSTAGTSLPPASVCSSAAFSYTDSRNYGTFPNDSRDVQGTLTYDVPSEYSLKHWFDTSFNPTEPLPLDSRAAGAPKDSRVAAIIPENSRADF